MKNFISVNSEKIAGKLLFMQFCRDANRFWRNNEKEKLFFNKSMEIFDYEN